MAGVQGMAYTAAASGLPPPAANKAKGGSGSCGSGGFDWQDMTYEAGSAEFFDQYVELGDSDGEGSATDDVGGNEGRGGGGGNGLGHFSGGSDLPVTPHLSSVSSSSLVGGGGQGQMLLAVGNGDISNDGGCAVGPGREMRRQHQQHHQQLLYPHYRESSNMTVLRNPEVEVYGLPYGGFGEGPGGGSISDSELLKLEGLTMRSPRMQLPQLSASEPASPPSKSSASPRKASRLESFCTKIRNKAATLHGKGKQAEIKAEQEAALSIPVMSTAQMMEPARGRPRPRDLHISKAQLPSPPLTSGMPNQQLVGSGSDASFVNGFLDDPFMADRFLSGQFVPPLQLNGSTMPQTPMQTPSLVDAWQLPLMAPNGKPCWTGSSPFLPAVNGSDAGWWDPSTDAMDTDLPVSYHANARSFAVLQHQQTFEYPAPPGTEDPSFVSIHMPQPRGIPPAVLHSDTTTRPSRGDHRRPNPRAPSSGARHRQYGPGISPRKGRAVSGAGSSSTSRIGSVSPGPKPHPAGGTPSGRLHRRSASMQTLTQPGPSLSSSSVADGGAAIRKRRSWTGRRTSSGSLHHQYHTLAAAAAGVPGVAGVASVSGGGGGGGSPSRRRTNTQSSSRPVSFTTASFSPSVAAQPNNGHHTLNGYPHHPPHPPPNHNNKHKPTSPSKCPPARPITNTIPPQTIPHRTPTFPSTTTSTSTSTSSSSNEDHHHDHHHDINADTDGFVNYTPQDHTLLMTGVAPSGSSKTKARREREAAERQREFRERLARMVRAAGGDVRKLAVDVDVVDSTHGGEGDYVDGVGGGDRDRDYDVDGDDGGEVRRGVGVGVKVEEGMAL